MIAEVFQEMALEAEAFEALVALIPTGSYNFGALTPEIMFLTALIALFCYVSYLLHFSMNRTFIGMLCHEHLVTILGVLTGAYLVRLISSDGSTILAFNDYFIVNDYTTLFKFLLSVTTLIIIVSSKHYLINRAQPHLEFALILGLVLLFLLGLVGANHLFVAFLCIVGFSLNIYVLIMFDPTLSASREAGIKYYYLSAFSAGVLVFGCFLLLTAPSLTGLKLVNDVFTTNQLLLSTDAPLIHYALLFMLVGLFFKLSAFPGHL